LCEAHEAEVLIGDTSNDAFSRELPQTVDGENAIDILIGVVMIIMIVRDHQLSALEIAREHPPTVIAFNIVRFLLAQMYTSRADERKYSLF
jgi:hypothetical protein